MKKVIIDISLDSKEALGLLRDYLDDNNLSYEVKGVKETSSLVESEFMVGDIVTIVGNNASFRHFLGVGEVCQIVSFYRSVYGVVEVSPLTEEGYIQRVHADDIKLV